MPRSGLIALSDGVRAYFEDNGVSAVVTPVGWKYRTFQVNQGPGGGSRVCLIPGKLDPSSPSPPKVVEAGEFALPQLSTPGPKLGGRLTGAGNPRPLVQWRKLCTLSVWAVDPTDPSNEEKQLAATEALLEVTYQAMHNAVDPVTGRNVGLADLMLKDGVWVLPPVEMAFGREFVAYFVHEGPLFDKAIGVVVPSPAILRDPAS